MNRRGWLAFVGVPVALVSAGAAWWFAGASHAVADPPALADRSDVDPDVASLIEQSYAQVRANPRDAPVRARLAMAYHANSMLEPAVACYEQALALDDSLATTWYQLAMAKAELGDPSGAVDAVRRAAKLSPSYAPARWRLGLWLMDLQQMDDAAAAFQEAARIDPADPGGALGLARIALARGDPDRAVQILQDVLKRNPNNGLAHQLLGRAYQSLGKSNDAFNELSRAMAKGASVRDPWNDEVRRLRRGYKPVIEDAQVLLMAGRGAEALPALEDLRRRRPDDIPLLMTLGSAYQQVNQIDRALATMQDALARNPNHFAVHLNLGHLYAVMGKMDLAMAHVNRAIELNPWLGQAHALKGELLARGGKQAEAIESLQEALRVGGPDVGAFMMLSDLLAARGNLDEAAAYFQKAQRLNPDDPRLAALAGRLRQLQGAGGERTAPK